MKKDRKTLLLLLMLVFTAIGANFLNGCNNNSGKTDDDLSVKQGQVPADGWKVPINPPNDSLASQQDYYELGWKTFVAINWPSDPAYRGKPDTSLSIGAVGKNGFLIPAVWEGWQEQFNIFLPGAVNPGPWNQPDSGCAGGVEMGLKVLRQFSKSNKGTVNEAFNEATANPLIDQDSQYVRYEVRVNEAEYDYIVTNQYYDSTMQKNAVAAGKFAPFPDGTESRYAKPLPPSWARYGATEVKASWRIFTAKTPASIKERYYRTRAILVDPWGNCTDTAEIGLVGLHILRLTPYTHSTWYWASFEQIDNINIHPEYGGTLPAHPTFNTNPPVQYGDTGYSYIPAAIVPFAKLPAGKPVGVSRPAALAVDKSLESVNAVYRKLLAGTPFQFYHLVGVVTPPSPGQTPVRDTGYGQVPSVSVNTAAMINTTMETYVTAFAKQSNCITCHVTGYPYMPANTPTPYPGTYQIFSFLLGNNGPIPQNGGANAVRKK